MMGKIVLLSAFFISTNCLHAQNTPSDLVRQLPKIFTGVCSAGNAEVQSYGEQLAALSKTLKSRLDALSADRIKAQSTRKFNPDPDNSALESQFEHAKKMISKTDFSVKFDKALHSDAERIMQQRLDENLKKQSASSDYRETEKLMAEVIQIRVAYCQAASPNYIELLMQHRSALEADMNFVIAADDLHQKMNVNRYGFTYFPELSNENGYIRIVDHLQYMTLLLSFHPGEVQP
jgi:hypothetical protein